METNGGGSTGWEEGKKMRHLDLFSGIGGFALAAHMVGGIETVQFVEIDNYCQKILAKNFPGVPIHGDITTFTAEPGSADIITFGSPCQDLSSANPDGRGLEGERSGLFYEAIRIVRMVQPRFAVFENVPNLLVKDNGIHFQRVLRAFWESGFDAEWQVVSAASVGAPHLRERVFIVAYPNGSGREKFDATTISKEQGHSAGLTTQGRNYWRTEPGVCGVDARFSHRLDRIRGLGNAVVPQVASIALQRVLELAQCYPDQDFS